MNEERENGRFDPADFIPADAQPKVAVSCELEEPPRGSALTGILGALFGALVGAAGWASWWASQPAGATACSRAAAPHALPWRR